MVRCECGRYSVRGLCDGGCEEGSGGLRDEYEVEDVTVDSDGVMVLAVSVVAAE